MKSNLGTIDRSIRAGIAVLIGILLLNHVLIGTVALVLGVLAIIFLLTSAIALCPLYIPFDISTKSKKPPHTY
jgi:hypothetical protein